MLETRPVVLLGITASQIHEGKAPKWVAPVTILAEKAEIERLTSGLDPEFHEGTEILPGHTDIFDDDGNIMVRIHETAACHSYHQMANGIRVASIPTMLQFVFRLHVFGCRRLRDYPSDVCGATVGGSGCGQGGTPLRTLDAD
jgi:hypothetical protein